MDNFVEAVPMVGCKESIHGSCNKFCVFKGRARRSEFWFLFLLIFLISVIIWVGYSLVYYYVLLDEQLHKKKEGMDVMYLAILGGSILAEIIILIPLIATGARRLHDIGKSACFLWIAFIPFGIFVLFYFFMKNSYKEINEYGDCPKYPTTEKNLPINYNSPIQVESAEMAIIQTPANGNENTIKLSYDNSHVFSQEEVNNEIGNQFLARSIMQ